MAKSPKSHLLEELRAKAESVSAKRVEQQQLSREVVERVDGRLHAAGLRCEVRFDPDFVNDSIIVPLRNVDRVEDGVYLCKKALGILEKRRDRLRNFMPVVLGILSQHPERFAVDLSHPGRHVKFRIVVWRRTSEDCHPRHATGQQCTKSERMRATSRMAKYRTSIKAQMIEHLRNVARMSPNGPAGKRVGKSETRPIEGNVAEARVVIGRVSDQATSRRAVTVHDDRSRGVGVAPNCKTHVSAVSGLQPVGAKRPVHPAESTG